MRLLAGLIPYNDERDNMTKSMENSIVHCVEQSPGIAYTELPLAVSIGFYDLTDFPEAYKNVVNSRAITVLKVRIGDDGPWKTCLFPKDTSFQIPVC